MRLAQRSRESGIELGRLRRRVVFERLLVRLDAGAPGMWVLKGGMALEVRLRDRARTTKDLDLMTRLQVDDGASVREHLLDALVVDVEADRFTWEVSRATDLQPDEAGRPGWRLTVTARLAGREFASVRLDVVARPEEIGPTERLTLPNSLAFDEFPSHQFETVSPAQHFAEKLHALTRDYGRENSRTRDLVDLVLLIENDLVTADAVMPSVRLVFTERRAQEVPAVIGDVPASWSDPYRALAQELDVGARSTDEGLALLRRFWAQAIAPTEETPHG
jgi:predicted nucleotidyltransferase component of viral defense system